MSANMALIMIVEFCAIKDKAGFRKQYPRFARKQSPARNKPRYFVLSSGR